MSRITRLGMVVLIAATPVAGAAVFSTPAVAQQNTSAVEKTQELTNYGTGDKFDASVRVSATSNLVDRQQVEVDLAGFKPSWNANNAALNGVRVEYPVVVMQCRGADPDRNSCIHDQRNQWAAGFDANAPAEQRAVADLQDFALDVSHYPGATDDERRANFVRGSQLPLVGADNIAYHWTSDVRSDGSGAPLIDDANEKSYPPTDVTGEGSATISTRNMAVKPNGTNEFLFELRQNASQPSLGCTNTRKCSLVLVPVMDMACVDPLPAKGAACKSGPQGPAPETQSQFTDSPNDFLTGKAWLAESNWRNKIVVPLEFAPDLASCGVQDSRAAAPSYGSELVAVAQERWGAAYCSGVRQSSYLPRYSVGSEYLARRQITTKLGPTYQQDAVFVTQPVTESPRPIAHAPTAITGFAVAFTVDDASGRQAQNMTLSPRLLAKLITQSYNPVDVPVSDREGRTPWDGTPPITDADTAARYYVVHPALFNNPRSLFADLEFAELNPDFALKNAAGRLVPWLNNTFNMSMFTIESDIMMDLTRYIMADKPARAWLDGQPDRWGTRVNPAYLNMQPTQFYSLLDTWVRLPQPKATGWNEAAGPTGLRLFLRGGGDTCDETFRTPYLTKIANISNSTKADALMLLDRRGSATSLCTFSIHDLPKDQQPKEPQFPGDILTQDVRYSESKATPAEFGLRAQLALTTVAQADLYELPTAKLVNAGGKAVAPTPGTMVNAMHAVVADPTTGTVRLDHAKVTEDNWYPGTMAAFMAVPTGGLDRQLAARYADYIEFMATTGQVPGTTLANLPAGYDPLPPAWVKYAKDVAKAVREQRGEVPTPPPGPLDEGLPATNDQVAQGDNPGSGLPANNENDSKDKAGAPDKVAKTSDTSSWLARWAIPLLIGFGLLAGVVAFGVQLGSRPDHPVRRALDAALRAVGRR
jgi:hypothetical protein